MKKISPYIGGFLAVMFVSIVGFLAVQKHLDYIKKDNANLNVYINKIGVLKSSDDVVSKESIDTDKLSASFDVNLVSKNGKIIYDVDIVNDGIVDARIDDIEIGREKGKGIEYSYENLRVDDVIKAGSKVTLKLILENDNTTENPSKEDLVGKIKVKLVFAKSF